MELYRNRARRNGAKTTYIVFGGIPSLLHIHDIHVKDRPELHLHKADRSAPTLGTLQKELLIHANNRQDSSRSPRGTALLRGSSERSRVGHNKSFIPVGTRAHPRNDGVSGCVGASGLFVKHSNAVKVGI